MARGRCGTLLGGGGQGDAIEVRVDLGTGGGLQVKDSFRWTAGDQVQLAVEPFFGYEPPGAGFVARFGIMVALEEDLGLGTEEAEVASFRTMLGGKL